MTLTEEIELKASNLILELESMGKYGIAQFAGVLVERRPELADELALCIKLNQEELKCIE
jgi:hypothetical protein